MIKMMDKNELKDSKYNYIDIITGLFVAVILISNIASTKIVQIWRFTFDGGTILFPLSYIFGDVLTEVYGFKAGRRVIWIGFFSALLMSVVFGLVGLIKPAAGWENQQAWLLILGQTPRIVAASLIAYFAGEFSNSIVLAKMKIFTKGRFLWTRTIGSTLAGEGIDTVLFVIIAFGGVYSWRLVALIIVSNYIFKVGMEIVLTPATYAIVSFLKRREKIDYFDYGTKFNPFRFKD
ncbi:MAG: Inner membrane protein YhhQ [Actinobacteria bacterium ADurb.Bin346]|nr:MAG: Inner membrane protein YhhQ [Actinobacteria bacterium ADurb.Bin346]